MWGCWTAIPNGANSKTCTCGQLTGGSPTFGGERPDAADHPQCSGRSDQGRSRHHQSRISRREARSGISGLFIDGHEIDNLLTSECDNSCETKSEIRRSKSEGSPKPESQRPALGCLLQAALHSEQTGPRPGVQIRPSAFGFLSDFGFRPSDFTRQLLPRKSVVIGLALAFLGTYTLSAAAPPSRDYPVKPVPFTAVRLNDLFWAPRIETNRAVTIPFAFQQCEKSGRMDNFERAAKALRGEELTNRRSPPHLLTTRTPTRCWKGLPTRWPCNPIPS